MQDRVSLYPGRVKLEPVAGQANLYDLTRADQPTQEGTPLNKASLLKDSTAALLGLPKTAVPDDAFVALVLGQGVYGYRVKVQLSDGTPVEGATVSGIQPLTGSTLVTGADGTVLGKSASASVTIGCTSPYIDQKAPASQSVASTGTITDVTLTLVNNTDVLTITSSQTINPKFSKLCTTFDICAVGGGGGGGSYDQMSVVDRTTGGSGAGGGYTLGLNPNEVESILTTVGAAANNPRTNTNTTESYFTINGTRHQFSVTQSVKPGPATWSSVTDGKHNGKNGVNGFHIFGDAALMVVGSSGGSGGALESLSSGVASGGTGGEGAGNGGQARIISYNNISSNNGSDATKYGCGGGGGGGFARDSGGNSKSSNSGNGKQGACFLRFHFAA